MSSIFQELARLGTGLIEQGLQANCRLIEYVGIAGGSVQRAAELTKFNENKIFNSLRHPLNHLKFAKQS